MKEMKGMQERKRKENEGVEREKDEEKGDEKKC